MTVDSTRTCVGCGTSDAPEAFERFVWAPETGLLHDLRRKAPGRGAHVHADPDCLTRAAKAGFRRSFRADVAVDDADGLVAEVGAAVRQRVLETLRVAVRSGAAATGARSVEEQMKLNTASVVFIARDAGEATRKKYTANAERKGMTIVIAFDGATIGEFGGRDFVAVMTVGGRLAERVAHDMESLERLGCIEG